MMGAPRRTAPSLRMTAVQNNSISKDLDSEERPAAKEAFCQTEMKWAPCWPFEESFSGRQEEEYILQVLKVKRGRRPSVWVFSAPGLKGRLQILCESAG